MPGTWSRRFAIHVAALRAISTGLHPVDLTKK